MMEDSTHSSSSLKVHSNSNTSIVESRSPPTTSVLSFLGNTEIDNAVQFWKQFDLPSSRNQWDKICNEMREMKTASIAGRKRLNDLTKAFRAKSKEEQSNGVSELLKAYQEEIDQLSRRSKLSETSFFGMYKSFYDAPDPGYYLEQLTQSVLSSNTHTLEIERLKAELTQYDEEFQRLKNQEVTIRRLEEQLQEFHQSNEQQILEEVGRRSDLIRQECDQQVFESKEMQKSIERRLALAIESAKQAQLSSDRTQEQLFEVSTRYEEKLSALLSENTLLSESIQRLQLRCNEIENENENLRKGTASAYLTGSSSPYPIDAGAIVSDGSERHQSYDLFISQLRQEIQEKDDRLRVEKASWESSLREAQQLQAKERELNNKLKQELQERPTKQEFHLLKRRLKIVEKVAFHSSSEDRKGFASSPEEDEDDGDVGPENTTSENHLLPLETLLSSKIQTLEKDMVEIRKQNLELKENDGTQREIISNLKLSVENKQHIILRLEQELETRNNTLEKMIKDQNYKKENVLTDIADLIGVNEPATAFHRSTRNDSAVSAGSGKTDVAIPAASGSHGSEKDDTTMNQMIAILTNQRDRYKEKLTQAEATILRAEEALEAIKAAKAQLEEENVQLFAKIKFLQSYHPSNGSSSVSVSMKSKVSSSQDFGVKPSRSNISEESRYNHDQQDPYYRRLVSATSTEDIESKYDHLYEQRMNPFAEFSLHEKQRKLRELSVADRIVLNTTLAIIQNHVGRNFLLIYFGAMHLLVFVTIYYTAHNVHHGCDPALDHIAAASSAVVQG